jgi:hypothetical protein
MSELPDVLAEILRRDDSGQDHDIVATARRQSDDPNLMLLACLHLWAQQRHQEARTLALWLMTTGVNNPIAHLVSLLGALRDGSAALDAGSVASLAWHYDVATPELRALIGRIFEPAMLELLFSAHAQNDVSAIVRLAEIAKACLPALREIFDWHAPATIPQAGAARPASAAWRSPPPGARRVPYRVVVAMRRKLMDSPTPTRAFDMGPRLAQAASAYGWPATLYCGQFRGDLSEDAQAVLAECRSAAADILILDDDCIANPAIHAQRAQLLAALRRMRPSIRIVAVHFDCWDIGADELRAGAEDVDAIWTTTPSLPVWQEPVFAGKLLHAPFPHAGFRQAPAETPPARIGFIGSLLHYNWPRMLWRAGAIEHGLPIDWTLSYHVAEDLPPLDSYRGFMQRLAESGCALNLAMRRDGSRIVTGRTFEAPLAGALLIQETVPDLEHFFVAGEHYLPFTSFAELRAVCDLVTQDPARAQKIRRAGHEFAVARYADDRLIGYLDALLFHA